MLRCTGPQAGLRPRPCLHPNERHRRPCTHTHRHSHAAILHSASPVWLGSSNTQHTNARLPLLRCSRVHALKRPSWGGSYSSGESSSEEDDSNDWQQDLTADGFDEFSSRSPTPPKPRRTAQQRADLAEELAATSGLGAVSLFDEITAQEEEQARRELEQLQREGGDVGALAAQLAADGFDLDADWQELDQASSTTGRAKLMQQKQAQGRPTLKGRSSRPADVLYAPPSNPRLEASRREERQEVTRRRRRLFDSPSDSQDIMGGYTTEVTKISYEEALRRQSELRGQKLRSLPKSWEEQGPPPEAPGIGSRQSKANVDDALSDFFMKGLQKAYQDKSSGKSSLQRPKPRNAAELAQQQQDKAVQQRRQQREQQEREQQEKEDRQQRVAAQQARQAEADDLELLLAEQLGILGGQDVLGMTAQKQGPVKPVRRPGASSSGLSGGKAQGKRSSSSVKSTVSGQASTSGMREEEELEALQSVSGSMSSSIKKEPEMDDFEAAYAAILAAQASGKGRSTTTTSSRVAKPVKPARPASPPQAPAKPQATKRPTTTPTTAASTDNLSSSNSRNSRRDSSKNSSSNSSSISSSTGRQGSEEDDDDVTGLDLIQQLLQQQTPRAAPQAPKPRALAPPTGDGPSTSKQASKQQPSKQQQSSSDDDFEALFEQELLRQKQKAQGGDKAADPRLSHRPPRVMAMSVSAEQTEQQAVSVEQQQGEDESRRERGSSNRDEHPSSSRRSPPPHTTFWLPPVDQFAFMTAHMRGLLEGMGVDLDLEETASFAPLEAPCHWFRKMQERGLLMEGYLKQRRVEWLEQVESNLSQEHDKAPPVLVPHWSYQVVIPMLHNLGKRRSVHVWIPEKVLSPQTQRAASQRVPQISGRSGKQVSHIKGLEYETNQTFEESVGFLTGLMAAGRRVVLDFNATQDLSLEVLYFIPPSGQYRPQGSYAVKRHSSPAAASVHGSRRSVSNDISNVNKDWAFSKGGAEMVSWRLVRPDEGEPAWLSDEGEGWVQQGDSEPKLWTTFSLIEVRENKPHSPLSWVEMPLTQQSPLAQQVLMPPLPEGSQLQPTDISQQSQHPTSATPRESESNTSHASTSTSDAAQAAHSSSSSAREYDPLTGLFVPTKEAREARKDAFEAEYAALYGSTDDSVSASTAPAAAELSASTSDASDAHSRSTSSVVSAIRATVAAQAGLQIVCEVAWVSWGGVWCVMDVDVGGDPANDRNSSSSADVSSSSSSSNTQQTVLGYIDKRHLPDCLSKLHGRALWGAVKPGDLFKARLEGTVFTTKLWQRDVVIVHLQAYKLKPEE